MIIKNTVTVNMMAGRIEERNDNIYKKEVIYEILKMFMGECQEALMRGENVRISGVGTLYPEVKTRKTFNLPVCNNDKGNPPYTRLRFNCSNKFNGRMKSQLLKNIDNGIYGLEKLPFDKCQITNLKRLGYIPTDDNEEIEDE